MELALFLAAGRSVVAVPLDEKRMRKKISLMLFNQATLLPSLVIIPLMLLSRRYR